MKKYITLGTTYYECPTHLLLFIKTHIDHVDELIIVDDGSSLYPIEKVLKEYLNHKKLKLFKVTKDYGFNSHGCRNLIMTQTSNDFVILMDCDRLMVNPKYMCNIIKTKKLRKDCRYRFVVHLDKLGIGTHPSVNDYLIHKDHFFSVGGYDEEIIGVRSGDRSFFKQLKNVGVEKVLHECDVQFNRGPSINCGDVFVSKNDRSMTKDESDLLKLREKYPDINKSILTFDWKKIN